MKNDEAEKKTKNKKQKTKQTKKRMLELKKIEHTIKIHIKVNEQTKSIKAKEKQTNTQNEEYGKFDKFDTQKMLKQNEDTKDKRL